MTTTAPQLDTDLHVEDAALQLRSALYTDGVADHLLAGEEPPAPAQVALVLRALSDFPQCMRILPLAGYRRLGDGATGVRAYLAGFATSLAVSEDRLTYDPRYWILGAPVTDRLARTMADLAGSRADVVPSRRQAAAVLAALAADEAPHEIVAVAGDGDLPWNGATGVGRWLRLVGQTVASGMPPAARD